MAAIVGEWAIEVCGLKLAYNDKYELDTGKNYDGIKTFNVTREREYSEKEKRKYTAMWPVTTMNISVSYNHHLSSVQVQLQSK